MFWELKEGHYDQTRDSWRMGENGADEHCSFPSGSVVKNLPAVQETLVRSLGQKDVLEKGMATYPSILAWGILWTGEPGRMQSIGSHRVRHG